MKSTLQPDDFYKQEVVSLTGSPVTYYSLSRASYLLNSSLPKAGSCQFWRVIDNKTTLAGIVYGRIGWFSQIDKPDYAIVPAEVSYFHGDTMPDVISNLPNQKNIWYNEEADALYHYNSVSNSWTLSDGEIFVRCIVDKETCKVEQLRLTLNQLSLYCPELYKREKDLKESPPSTTYEELMKLMRLDTSRRPRLKIRVKGRTN